MTTAAVIALIAINAVLVGGLLLQGIAHRRERTDMLEGFRTVMREDAELHAAERRELANRIQRPDILPANPAKPRQRRVPPDAANLRRIGTVAPPQPSDEGA